jgi:hypothetical protein
VSIAAEAMLEKNRFIDFIRLASTYVACKCMGSRLHRFHREPLPKPTPDHTGFRIGFLSVVRLSPCMNGVDAGVLSLIFEMSFEPLLRVVHACP